VFLSKPRGCCKTDALVGAADEGDGFVEDGHFSFELSDIGLDLEAFE
jgi:hypothetical protein